MNDRIIDILGSGQLERMMVEAADRSNINPLVLEKEDVPAKHGPSGVIGSFRE